MSEPFFRATTPDNRQTVDVVLGEDGDGFPTFWCRVVLDNNWTHPLEELKTDSQQKLIGWMHTQMKEMMRRSGT